VKILVTAKRVVDPDSKIEIDDSNTSIELDDVDFRVNYFCENAIEAALEMQDEHDAEVVVCSIGDEDAIQTIRTGLAMGGDRGILVEANDGDLDGDLVARTLAKLYEQEQPDIFLLGKQAIDGDSNQVGQLLAEYLDIPQACFASKIDIIEGGKVARVEREVDGGIETIDVDLPCIITADLRLNEPRYASLPGIMKAKRKKIDEFELEDLGVDSTLKVVTRSMELPAGRQAGVMVADVDELVNKLKSEAKVL
jgi:electron transfer flavoprotein beta subunit